MKKSTKIILPALALLVLGTTATATGTVAWFAANGVVSASGMQVQCATSKNLIIANVDPTDSSSPWVPDVNYGAAVNTAKSARTLSPSSTSKNKLVDKATTDDQKFFYVKDKINAATGSASEGASVVQGTEANNYYVAHKFWLANSAPENMSLSISVLDVKDKNGATLTSAISRSLRVAVVYSDLVLNANWGEVYGPVDGFTASYQGLIAATSNLNVSATPYKDGDTSTNVSEAVTPVAPKTVIDPTGETPLKQKIGYIKSTKTAVTTEKALTWSPLTVYVWYEGQDSACTSNNALSVEDVKISLSFQADALSADDEHLKD